MGSFRDIVRLRLGSQGLINNFTMSGNVLLENKNRQAPYSFLMKFCEEQSQPALSSIEYRFSNEEKIVLEHATPFDTNIITKMGNIKIGFNIDIIWSLFFLNLGHFASYTDEHEKAIIDYLKDVFAEFTQTDENYPRVPRFSGLLPIAPLRSTPKRTYDPVRETESPMGEHVPMLMMRLDHADKKKWNKLHDGLISFGRASGLFSDISVRRHGKRMSDPFQLQVKVRSGSGKNIIDVGYGVSQSLPILVDIRNQKQCTFLLQQPEVHLHPRAQAELGSLFVESWKSDGNRFMIETHSDYIIDRMRILVRKGELSSEDITILYFEPKGNSVRLHNLDMDESGNLVDVPNGYRDFFVYESDRLLGFED